MAIQKLSLRPGVNTQLSPTANTSGLSASNLVRFREGLLEKLGGWDWIGGENEGANVLQTIGTVRGLHAFEDLSSIAYLALGSEQRLELYTPSTGTLTDITPIRKTSNLTTPFTSNDVTDNLTVTDINHGAVVGDWIYIPFYTYANIGRGGNFVLLQGFYRVNGVTDANNYTISPGTFSGANNTDIGVTSLFTTTLSSNSVKVTLGGYVGFGWSVGSIYTIYSPTTVGGLTLSGQYLIATTIDNTDFTITATSAATSGATASENGGQVQIQYLLSTGNVSDITTLGYGTGAYGVGAYGEGAGGSYISPLRNWFLDNFGQNLVVLPTGGTLYQWVPPIAPGNVAQAVSNAPLYGNGMFVAIPQEQVMILGAETGGTQDPMLIRWCDVGVITDWTASATNQAGSYRLSRGSMIVGGLAGPLFIYVWTDLDLWQVVYQGYPFVYGFNTVGENCGLISPKGSTFYNNTVYWMSKKNIFQFSTGAGMTPIPCPIWDWIFDRLDNNNLDKIFVGANSLFNEVAGFFPSTDSDNPTPGEIDSYWKYNVLEGEFDYGNLVRYAWIDQSVLGNPIATGQELDSIIDAHPVANPIFQHEIGYDAGIYPMTGVMAQTGYFDVSEGLMFLFVDWLIPDFVWKTIQPTTQPRVTITIYTAYYPGDINSQQIGTFGPYTITPTTQYITIRTRARQMAIKIESDTIDTFWRIGAFRIRSAPAGRV